MISCARCIKLPNWVSLVRLATGYVPAFEPSPTYRQRCIYFRLYDDRVVIVRVLHGSQDIDRQEF